MENNKSLLIVQRVITPYRFELLVKLAPYFKKVSIVSSYGEKSGANRAFIPDYLPDNVEILWHKALNISYKGDTRSSALFFYPQSIIHIFNADIILCEGTTNLINNAYLIPLGKLFRRKIIWWDAGYSPERRTFRRKLIDLTTSVFIGFTDKQAAYSSNAKTYMETHMNAKRCEVVLNTIATDYYDTIHKDVVQNAKEHKLDPENISLLYVGAVEKRKKLDELLLILHDLSEKKINLSLTIIGDGNYLEECKSLVKSLRLTNVKFLGRILDKSQLKNHYFEADLFVMPGDGGLGIAQSILFGLPIVCVSSDGTEYDYIDNHDFILNCLDEFPNFLEILPGIYNRASVLPFRERLMDKSFIASMCRVLQE